MLRRGQQSQNPKNSENPGTLHQLHKGQLQAAFRALSKDKDAPSEIPLEALPDLGRLFGQEFEMDELVLAAKGTMEEDVDGEKVLLSKFAEFIEEKAEETKLDPYCIFHDYLSELKDPKIVSSNRDISIQNLK